LRPPFHRGDVACVLYSEVSVWVDMVEVVLVVVVVIGSVVVMPTVVIIVVNVVMFLVVVIVKFRHTQTNPSDRGWYRRWQDSPYKSQRNLLCNFFQAVSVHTSWWCC